MVKLLVLVLACAGTWFLMGKYLPQAWDHKYGLTIGGYFLSAAVLAVVVVAFLVWRGKK